MVSCEACWPWRGSTIRTLAGGDTAQSPQSILADILVLGTVPKGMVVLRSGARPGDRIYVTGELGGGSAALKEFFAGRKPTCPGFSAPFSSRASARGGRISAFAWNCDRHDRFERRNVDRSRPYLRGVGGGSRDRGRRSSPGTRRTASGRRVDLKLALHGGDDYELLFTAPAHKRVPASIDGVPVTAIGRITRARRVILRGCTGVTQALKAARLGTFSRVTRWDTS